MAAAKPIANVSAVMLDAARTYVGDEYRPALQGVYIHPHPVRGAVLVATDGHRLVIIHDEKGTCRKACLVIAGADLTRALKGAKDPHRADVSADGLVTIPGLYAGATSAFAPKGSAFPEYRRLISSLLDLIKEPKRQPASFNGRYLADAAKIGQRLSGNKGAPIRVVTFGASDMALTLWPNTLHAFGFIMPMRTDDVAAVPRFFEPVMRGFEPPVAEAA